MRHPGIAAAACCLLMISCAGYQAVPTTPSSEARSQIGELESALQDAERELEQLHAEERPDCSRACNLGRTICELASKICRISERHPEQAEIQQKCQDAVKRCERARVKVGRSCKCPT